MRWYQVGIYFLMCVFGLELLFGFPTKTNTGEITPAESPLEEQKGLVYRLKNIHSAGRPNGNGPKEWEVWADEATKPKRGPNMDIFRVKTKFFGEKGLEFLVVGKTGNVNEKDLNLAVRGNVLTKSSNGYWFQTEEILYQSKSRVLTSDDPVKMLGPQKGKDFKLDGVIRILSNVKARKFVEETNKMVKIESETAEFSGHNNQTKFIRNVIIDVESVRVTGREAIFQFNKNSSKVESILVQGQVRVSDLDKWATAEQVRYDLADNKFTFKGHPRLVQNSDELFGEEIVFLNGGKNVRVFKARAKVEKSNLENKQ